MKLFLCKSFETSDDDDDENDEEEEVSEEEQQDESIEDEDNAESAAESNDEEDAPDDVEGDGETESESAISKDSEVKLNGKSSAQSKDSIKVNGKSSKTNEVENESNDASGSETEIAVKNVNGKLEINYVKQEETLDPQAQFNGSNGAKIMSSTKSTISVPARLKNVSTETMVIAAIRSLNERGGSSAIAIKKYIMNNYPQLDGPRMLMLIKKFIKKALMDGKLVQSKGIGVGGSFKVSAETNRLEEKKEREKRKKLMQKPKKDVASGKDGDKKTKPSTKTKTKKSEKGEKKATATAIATATATKTTTKKMSKTKTNTTAIKLDNGTELAVANQKVPKASAALKKVPKATDLKQQQPKKTAVNKDAVKSTAPINNGKPTNKIPAAKQGKASAKGISNSVMNVMEAEKPKKVSPQKAASLEGIPSSPIKAQPKGKALTTTKKKPVAKGKGAVGEMTDTAVGDADAAKSAKKVVGKKSKAK